MIFWCPGMGDHVQYCDTDTVPIYFLSSKFKLVCFEYFFSMHDMTDSKVYDAIDKTFKAI